MLEVRNLAKYYSTKGGVTVKALDDVSVQFPETGMVFLLGRSGSGKSTLLNVSGGLDKPDSGEIIVKGRSSKDFSPADFDSYRNTFIGFIFQEYNILNEFTVEQNIALALQLQNKPSDKQAVEDLLDQVDLTGFGKRKPNTLSGGQKQRVAIARALIKEPEIIMADEPTGALDSNTGKQVLDTLKKLSETKLVIIVSHDREFAEQYGDRIIELKDGQIISDVTKAQSVPKAVSENVEMVSEDTIAIKNADKITETDVKNIVAMLKKNGGEAIISAGKKDIPDVKRACRINDSGNKEYFKETDQVDIKEYDGRETKFIKSRLPASRAFKMGASGLKTKPIRLIFTILLSVVAFLMFGVVSTFMLYDESYSVSEALREADYPSLMISKQYNVLRQQIKTDVNTGESEVDYEYEEKYNTRFGVQELKDRNAAGGGLDYAGVYNFTNSKYSYNDGTSIDLLLGKSGNAYERANVKSDLKSYYPTSYVTGFTDCGADYMNRNGFNLLAGRYPETVEEIAISEYAANLFINSEGFGVANASNLIDKKVKFSGCNAIGSSEEFTIVGVYGVGQIPAKYDVLKDANDSSISAKEKEDLTESLTDYIAGGFSSLVFVTEGFYDEYKNNIHSEGTYIETANAGGFRISEYEISSDEIIEENSWYEQPYSEKTLENFKEYFKFYEMVDTEEGVKEITDLKLEKNQVLISQNMIMQSYRNAVSSVAWTMMYNLNYKLVPETVEALGEDGWFRNNYNNMYSLDEGAVAEMQEFIVKHYATIGYREYVLYMANNMSAYYSSVEGVQDIITKINKYVNPDEGITPDVPTNAEWAKVQTLVNENIASLKTDSPEDYYRYFGEKLYRSSSDKGDVSYLNEYVNGRDFNSVLGNLVYGKGSPIPEERELYEQNINGIKAALEENSERCFGYSFSAIEQNVSIMFEPRIDATIPSKVYFKSYTGASGELDVVGFFTVDSDNQVNYFVSDEFIDQYGSVNTYEQDYIWTSKDVTDYVAPEDAKYNYLITKTDNSQEHIASLLAADGAVVIGIKNQVYEELSMFLEMITELKQIFLILGAVFGVFAALMLLNFISVSISAKKKDIGILRAVGARGSDVFKIFFSEAFIIASICFLLASVGGFIVCNVINTSMLTIVKMKLLDFGIINVGLVFAVSFGISIIATFFPVYLAAKKSPVESIRAL
ncbi:MAG: ABC transporter ATP-binding protein/permease [Clostridiales bacterium]|nr:ABC transporter ATP-binding protein/permease [Clostridiales bacterium]